VNRLNSLRDGIYCSNSYMGMDNDSSSLTFVDGSLRYSEVGTGFLCSRGRGAQQKPPMPPHALPQLVINSALPGTVRALLGEAADVLDEQSHRTRRPPQSFSLSLQFCFRMEMGGMFFCPFLHAITLYLYSMGMCIISVMVSKYPHIRSALRSCSQNGEEAK